MASWPTVAELQTRLSLGTTVSADHTVILTDALEAAVDWVVTRTRVERPDQDVPFAIRQATFLIAARLFHRKDSPGGVVAFGDAAAEIAATDVDAHSLIKPYRPIRVRGA